MRDVDLPLRTRVHSIRVTPDEAAELTEHARAARISVSELLRRRALGRPLPSAAAPAINVQKYDELARLAANLNQSVRHANQFGVLDRHHFVTLVSDCLEHVKNLRSDLIGANR